jgi:hypothetical protein
MGTTTSAACGVARICSSSTAPAIVQTPSAFDNTNHVPGTASNVLKDCGGNNPFLTGTVDIASAASVPEPATLLLVGGGLLACARRARRQTRGGIR